MAFLQELIKFIVHLPSSWTHSGLANVVPKYLKSTNLKKKKIKLLPYINYDFVLKFGDHVLIILYIYF